ncbi:MAG TPA: SagB/ThcOx family dehydrogenase [Candidatus Atribacteria bacterium]|nr:SagB/ThcOx family dehydrogenase [Candidatus Atribacteria bacterium]
MSEKFRDFLKSNYWKTIDFSTTDQSKGIKPLPAEKPYNPEDRTIDLIKPEDWQSIHEVSVKTAITRRKSRRSYTEDTIKLEELSFLLWATQGLRGKRSAVRNYRTVPSAGCRHALETYIAVFRIEGIPKAIYRYLPLSHQLVEVVKYQDLEGLLIQATLDQSFAGKSAVTFIWTSLPARMEWRYDRASYKLIALDAGHVCQNLYLACEAIAAGTCAIAKYDQEFVDKILGIDGVEEFTIYMASVGKVQ